MKPILIATLTFTLAAATATTILDDIDLSAYERVDIAVENTGANAVTAATWQSGVSDGHSTVRSNDATQATAVQSALTSGGKSLTTLTDSDVPARLKVTATSSSGTTLTVIVTGRTKATDLFPTT
jgi:hypothetical protein